MRAWGGGEQKPHSYNFYYSIVIIVLLVTVVNFLLCLIYRLNRITGMLCKEKNIVNTVFGNTFSFKHPQRSWNFSPEDEGTNIVPFI